MRFDFIDDKRLMQEVSGGVAGSKNITEAEDQGFAARLETARPEEKAAIIAEWRALVAKRAIADKNSTTAGSSGLEAAAGAQRKRVEDTQSNSRDAAKASQDLLKNNYAIPQAKFEKALDNLMASENSIEQMKAGFSGMLEVFGIVLKKLGADEFAQGCLDLAKELRPNAVLPNEDILNRIKDLRTELNVDPSLTQGAIDKGYNTAIAGGRAAQADVDAAATDGVKSAGSVVQPTALDGRSGGRTVSSGITVGSFDGAIDKLTRGKNPILLGSAAADLHGKFGQFASQEGDKSTVDTKTERASLGAAIRMGIKDPTAQKQVLAELSLADGPK